MAVTALLCGRPSPGSAQTAPSLGTAESFALLAGTSVTNKGPSVVVGNVGVSPGSAITGLPDGQPQVGDRITGPVARLAQRDNAAAYHDLASRPCAQLAALTGTVAPGVYCVAASTLTGTMTLSGNADAVWIFRIAGSLTTADDSAIVLANGATSHNVFWPVAGTATLGARSVFAGSILAQSSITFGKAATMSGRALAQSGAVALDTNSVTLCCCCEPMTFAPATLPPATAGVPYNATITVAGGKAPYTFTLLEGTLPQGLTLSPGGVVSGTPATSGGSFIVLVRDANGCTAIHVYQLCGTITLAPLPIPLPVKGCAIEVQMTASGGTAPYTFTSSDLPATLKLAPNGVLTGLPPSGCSTFTVVVTDALGCATSGTVPICGLTISPATVGPFVVGTPVSTALSAAGGTGPYSYTVCSGALPPGLVLPPSGVLSGTPSPTGQSKFIVMAVDLGGAGAGVQPYTVDIVCPPITISPPPPPAILCVPYTHSFVASGGAAPYTFTITFTDPLPPTLTGNTDGTISGIPLVPGTYPVTVTVTDANKCSTTQTFTLVVACPTLTVSPAALPDATIGVPYTASVACNGGIPCTFTSSDLPPWLSLSPGGVLPGGVLSGTPPSPAQEYTFHVTATIGCCNASQTVKVKVVCYPVTISPAALPPATVGIPYSVPLSCSSGSCSFVASGLPPWLSLQSGVLAGTPQVVATHAFSITATDTNGCTGTANYTLNVVACPLGVGPPSLPDGTIGIFYSQPLTASGGSPPYTFTFAPNPSLPPGLTLSPGGLLSGFPTTPGRFNFVVIATYAGGCLSSNVYTVNIGPLPPSPPDIPALSGWGMGVLAFLFAVAGWAALWRRP